MKRMIILICLLYAANIYSQSVLTYGTGTSVGILGGADLCVNIKYGSGILYGSGTFCGSSIHIKTISTEIPDRFDIQQNYPNPFNNSSNIKFDVAKLCDVKIVVYDAMGREVEVLLSERLQPGFYQTKWDASAYSSGVYFYKITAGDFSETKRMLLVK